MSKIQQPILKHTTEPKESIAIERSDLYRLLDRAYKKGRQDLKNEISSIDWSDSAKESHKEFEDWKGYRINELKRENII